MRKSKVNYIEISDYGSESSDIIQNISSYLVEHGFYQNDEITNVSVLENGLINYSIIKLVDWNIDVEKISMDKLNDLESLCYIISSYIPTNMERYEYFMQYIHSIIYALGCINKQEQILLNKISSYDREVDFTISDNKVESIDINRNVPSYLLPIKLLNKVKDYFNEKEKNPVLQK